MTSRGRSIKGTMKGDYVIMRERNITRIKGKAVIRRGSNGCFFLHSWREASEGVEGHSDQKEHDMCEIKRIYRSKQTGSLGHRRNEEADRRTEWTEEHQKN